MLARSRLLLVFTAVIACRVHAAEPENLTAHYRDAADKLIDAALQDKAGYEKLTYLCDRIGNRLSGSETLPKAIAWAADQMKRDGFVNVVTPPVLVPKWVRGHESASLLAPVSKPLHMLGLGMSVGTPAGGITAEALVVSTFDELTALGAQVKGKIVVFDAPYEGYGKTVAYRVAGPSFAAHLGAVAMLVRSITPLAAQLPHTGATRYSPDAPQIPAAAISPEDAILLHRLQQHGDTPKVHLEMEAHMEPDVPSANVIGEIPGSEHPEEIVVMGGHIDSWDVGQGAQDDGSGIMATMEAARLIHQLNLKPKRTIRVVFWVNEENGERGGEAYLAWVGNHVKDHVAAIEMDSGAEEPKGFGYGVFGGMRRAMPGAPPAPEHQESAEQKSSRDTCQQIANLLSRIGADKVAPAGGGSDIAPIVGKGVPSLSPSTSGEHYFDWHHTQADTVDKVNLADFRKNIAVLAVLSYVLADMPGRLAGSVEPSNQ